MLLNIMLAVLLMVVITVIHASGMILGLHMMQAKFWEWKRKPKRSRIYSLSAIILLMFLTMLVEAVVWAGTYLALNAIETFEKALYFSMVTFTTLGYGDIVLNERWHLLASFEAFNGVIMFGWTTAIVIATVQHLYFGKEFKK